MSTTLGQFLEALGAKEDESNKLCWAQRFGFDGSDFLVKQTNSHFEFTLCSEKSGNPARDANRYESDKLWAQLTKNVNISRNKDAARIASEFKKRFNWISIQQYRERFICENVEYSDRKTATKQKAERLQKSLGSAMRQKSETSFDLDFPSGDYYGQVLVEYSVDFHLRGISDMELAEKLCRVVREHWESKRDGK